MRFAFTHCSAVLERKIDKDAAVVVDNGVISWMGPTGSLPPGIEETTDLGGFLLAPGYVDLHVHGGGGVDCSRCDPDDLTKILNVHATFGTTALCLAVVSSPPDVTRRALGNISSLASASSATSRLLGAYLEGPFLNPARCGSHEAEYLSDPDIDLIASFAHAAAGWLRIVTLAPELPGSSQIIDWLVKSGIVAAIGHTGATCEQTIDAIESGCKLVTHLFNGMKPFHHRDPNTAGAVLSSRKVVAELILDETHVHPAAARTAFNALGPDLLALVTDSTAVTGSRDNNARLGDSAIVLRDGAAYLDNGTLAGSALTMADAVRNSIDTCKLDIPSAVRSASLVPASVLGIADRLGSIAIGKYADLLVLDPSDLRVLETYVSGKRIFRSPY